MTTDVEAPPCRVLILPEEITPDLAKILGTICFECIPIVGAFRAAGRVIERRAEAEQAYCLHWFLKLFAAHGADWRKAASAELKALAADATAAAAEPTTGGQDGL